MSDDSHEYDEEVFANIGEIHEAMMLNDPLYKKGFEAGAASRDAEITALQELKQAWHDKFWELDRQSAAEIAELVAALDALRKALAKVRKP